MNGSERGEFAALQGLLRKKRPSAPGEVCDFCAVPVFEGHGHLVDCKARRIMCACRPCYLVFEPEGAARGRYKPIPTRYLEVDGFTLDDAAWDTLQIPIGLVFFFFNSQEEKMVAFYPGPAGATESQLPLDTWEQIVAGQPELASLQPDVEAILLHRRAAHTRCFLVPVDAAYELVGILRSTWKGFDGGAEAWHRIDAFFAALAERSRGSAQSVRR